MLSSAAAIQANAWGLRDTGSVIPGETWDDHGMVWDHFCMERPDEYYVPASHCRNDELGDDETPTYEEVYRAETVCHSHSVLIRTGMWNGH